VDVCVCVRESVCVCCHVFVLWHCIDAAVRLLQMPVCVCVCLRERKRERERELQCVSIGVLRRFDGSKCVYARVRACVCERVCVCVRVRV